MDTVLLVESDLKETDLYSDLIKEVAPCRVDAINRIGSLYEWIGGSNYNLVVIDISGNTFDQEGDAISILSGIKAVSPETAVIIITERPSVDEAVAAIRLGAEDYFQKPFNIEKFKMAIKRGMDRKAIFAESTGAAAYLHLLNACQIISASLDQKKIFEMIRSYFSQELKSNYSALYTFNSNQAMRIEEETIPDRAQDHAMEEVLDIAVYAANPFAKMQESQEVHRFIERAPLTPGLFIFQFKCVGPDDYFFVCLSPVVPVSTELFENKLRMLKRQIEFTGKNINEFIGVKNLIYVDDATGLYNTRYLNHILDREIEKAKTAQSSFAILFIDADHFKSVNDQHGHLVGTRLLNELGSHIKKDVRDSDTVFRYGGDEFVAVLSPCDMKTAKTVAERIRSSIATEKFLEKEGLSIHFTVSIGVALYPDHAQLKREIIQMADNAMYTAKKKSRNIVTVYDPSQDTKSGTA